MKSFLKSGIFIALGFSLALIYGYTVRVNENSKTNLTESNTTAMKDLKLGAFSMSLSVKDLKTSRAFYEKLGFSAFGGSEDKNYLIMKNGNALIGLFQGMFEGNILTFNPGWDENAKEVKDFNDVREIQQHLLDEGINAGEKIESGTSGPASFFVKDPDGNLILVDQHR